MKQLRYALVVLSLLLLGAQTHAQVTNLKVNGYSSNFTMVSGDTIHWEYNVPAGDTTQLEIYVDANNDGIIEPGTDPMFATFNMIEGDPYGQNGPGDMDGVKNGYVTFAMRVGLAPAAYIMRFTHHGVPTTILGTVTALTSPAHTISGKVTPPAGKSAKDILVSMERGDKQGEPPFWAALTDVNGNYAIQMNADTAGNPWRIRLQDNPYPPSIISPEVIQVIVAGNPNGEDFTLATAAAQVAGVLKDASGIPFIDADVSLQQMSFNGSNKWGRTGLNGFFQIGFLPSELPSSNWALQTNTNSYYTTNVLQARVALPTIAAGDSIFRQLIVYSVNSQITGIVRLNGNPPGMPMDVQAVSKDASEYSYCQADGATGNFTAPVSSLIASYNLSLVNVPMNYSNATVSARPGDSGVIINITTTSVDGQASPVPTTFALEQNFPNPFNPSTGIRYQVPASSNVKLTVFNALGQEVSTLVNEVKAAGSYQVQFNAANLPSGLYFYRMQAGNYVETKRMLLLK